MDLHGTSTPALYNGHLDNWVRDPQRTNTPSRRHLQQLYSASAVLLLHNHDGVHWGLSITLRKANHHHVLYIDSLNQRHPDLEADLTHFWTRSTRAAHSFQLTSNRTPQVTIHNQLVPMQTNNYDCGLFVLAYQRAAQSWLRTHLLTPRSPMDLRMSTLIATIRTVTQQEVTQLRQQLRNSLHQHCTVHLTTPPGFTCQATREDCRCLRTAQQPPAFTNMEQTPPPPPPTPEPDERNCHPAPPINNAIPTSPAHDHSTTPPSPTAATEPSPQAMLDQYSRDLQAIPAFIKTIEPQLSPTHSPNSTVAANVNQQLPQPTPTTQETHCPPADLGESAPPPQPSQQPTPIEAPDRKWRLRQYPLIIPRSSTSHDGNN